MSSYKEIIRSILIVTILLISFTIFSQKGGRIFQVQSFEVDSLIKMDIQLLDVRTPEEIQKGKIANAYELDWYEPKFKKRLNDLNLDKTKPILIYCKGGVRSMKAARKMVRLGFLKVYNLEKGYYDWKIFDDSLF